MTEQLDLAATLDLWIPLPSAPHDPDGWASTQAATVAERCGLDEGGVASLEQFLGGLVRLTWPALTHQRMLFLAHPTLGATVWDVSFLQPDIAPDDVVASAPVGQLSSEASTFTHLGVTGWQSVNFDLAAADGDDEQAITGRVVIGMRDERAERPATVTAQAETTHLESLMGSVTPMQYLLCSNARSGPTEQHD